MSENTENTENTDEVKSNVDTDTEQNVTTQEEPKEEVKKEEKISSSIFITEDDTFEISLGYYQLENKKFIVETIDDELLSPEEIAKAKDLTKIHEILKSDSKKEDVIENKNLADELSEEEKQALMEEFEEQGLDVYNPKNPKRQELKVRFKYPSQSDHEIITSTYTHGKQELTITDLLSLEVTRIIILIRDWNIDADITRLADLDPKLVKGLVNKVREVLGVQSLF